MGAQTHMGAQKNLLIKNRLNWAPKTNGKTDGKEHIHNFTLKINCLSMDK